MVCCVQLLRPKTGKRHLFRFFCGVFSNVNVLIVEELPNINMGVPAYPRGRVHFFAAGAVVFPKSNFLLPDLNIHAVELGLVMARQDQKPLASCCETQSKKSLLLGGDVPEDKVGGQRHGVRRTGALQGGGVHLEVN